MDTKNSANPPSNFDKNSDIPTEVIKFIVYMKKLYDNRSVNELKQVYDQGFIDISEKYYLERPWPNPSVIEKVITNPKQYFMIIYKEIYYRDIYYKSIKKPLPFYIQCESFTNLSSFFSLLLNSGKETEHPVTFLLPANWIWDIIESFINQYVSFCHYKANHSLRTIEENRQLEEIEKNQEYWNIYTVLNILYSLISKAQINNQLIAIKNGNNPDNIANEFGRNDLYFMFGYFAMIGLLRLQVHLGDYNEALQCIENFSLEPKGLFTTVPNCYITVYYYIAFSHMMTKNYIEAIKLFEICSLYIQKITNVYILQNLSYSKKNKELELFNVFQDKVLILLAICLTITPQKIEESIKTLLHDKYDETYDRMISGNVTEYEKNFIIGAPKFISPNCVVYEGNSISRQSLQHQCSAFINCMRGQVWTPVVRSYLKLYNTLTINKLSHLMDLSTNDVLSKMLHFKKITYITRRSEVVKRNDDDYEDTTLDLDFYIDNEVIKIADTRVTRNVSDYFLKNSLKFKALCVKAKAINLNGKSVISRRNPDKKG